MSQFDFGNLESPVSGEEFVNTYLEPWRDALHSMHKGPSQPSYAVVGTMWIQDNQTPWVLRVFDGASNISLGTIDPSSHAYSPIGISAAMLAVTSAASIAAGRTALSVYAKAETYSTTEADALLALKAALASPTFTGVPLAPTAAAGTNNTQIATTAFTKTAIDNAKVDTVLTGVPTAPTASVGTNTTQIATTQFVQAASFGALGVVTPVDVYSTSKELALDFTTYSSYRVMICDLTRQGASDPPTLIVEVFSGGAWFSIGGVPIMGTAPESNLYEALITQHATNSSTRITGMVKANGTATPFMFRIATTSVITHLRMRLGAGFFGGDGFIFTVPLAKR